MARYTLSVLQFLSDDAPWHLLYPRERAILARLQRRDTLASIARDLSLSYERVGQIRDRALFVLAQPSRLRAWRATAHTANPTAFAE